MAGASKMLMMIEQKGRADRWDLGTDLEEKEVQEARKGHPDREIPDSAAGRHDEDDDCSTRPATLSSPYKAAPSSSSSAHVRHPFSFESSDVGARQKSIHSHLLSDIDSAVCPCSLERSLHARAIPPTSSPSASHHHHQPRSFLLLASLPI